MTLTAERLRSLLRYDPETGDFTWIVDRPGSKGIGSIAGVRLKHGYVQIMIDGQRYLAHRLAFLWAEGEWPPETVDHRNGDPSDNRWSNLRKASQGENLQNRRKMKNNTSGFTGASWCKSMHRWQASIQVNRKPRHLGYFETAAEAGAAYEAAKAELHQYASTIRKEG